MEKEIKNQSIYKAIKILECFSHEQPELSITEISKMTGLYKSNVFNVVSTLARLGYLMQNDVTSRYYLGYKFAKLAGVVESANPLWKIAPKHVQQISNEANELAHFAVGTDTNTKILFVYSAYPDGMSSYDSKRMVGVTIDMHCTALGKAILASSSEQIISNYLENGSFDKITDYTITDKKTFEQELVKTRQLGYAVDDMEREYGIRCVAVPIFLPNGEVAGAISISGPSLRMTDEKIEVFSVLLKDQSKKIELVI